MTSTLEIEHRPLGRTDQTIPRIALGCGNFGGVGSAPAFFGQGQNEQEAIALMDAAWELGITHFDTADAYGGGRSEAAIGRWIKARGIRPGLTTKTYNPMDTGADHGLAPARINRQFAVQPRAARGRPRRALPRARVRPRGSAGRHDRRVRGARRRRPDRRLRRQQLRRPAARGLARSGRAPGDPERVLAAGARRRAGGAAAVRASPRRLFGVRAAVGRMADRQVPPRTRRFPPARG